MQIIGVAGRSDLDEMLNFVNDLGVDRFPHIFDEDGSVWSDYGVLSQPAFVFINDDGETSLHTGALGRDELTNRVEELRSS